MSEPESAVVPSAVEGLRVGDDDRGAVVDLLTRAHVEGRLDMTEHAERTEKALAARTVGDLGHLIEDLTPARVNAIVAPAGRSPIRATMSTTRREGPWTVPPVLHASVFLGEAKIDMTHAYFTTPVVTLDTSIIMGEVQLLVPEEINVLDEATHIMSEFKIKGSLDPAPGAPVIIVKGSSVMGSITVKVRH